MLDDWMAEEPMRQERASHDICAADGHQWGLLATLGGTKMACRRCEVIASVPDGVLGKREGK
jgi:hypothetical protein